MSFLKKNDAGPAEINFSNFHATCWYIAMQV